MAKMFGFTYDITVWLTGWLSASIPDQMPACLLAGVRSCGYRFVYFSSWHDVLLNCFKLFFIHLKLELLTQFPASNDEKHFYLWKINISPKLKYLISWASTTDDFINFSGILFGLKLSWKRIYPGSAGQGSVKTYQHKSFTHQLHFHHAVRQLTPSMVFCLIRILSS